LGLNKKKDILPECKFRQNKIRHAEGKGLKFLFSYQKNIEALIRQVIGNYKPSKCIFQIFSTREPCATCYILLHSSYIPFLKEIIRNALPNAGSISIQIHYGFSYFAKKGEEGTSSILSASKQSSSKSEKNQSKGEEGKEKAKSKEDEKVPAKEIIGLTEKLIGKEETKRIEERKESLIKLATSENECNEGGK